MYIVLTNVFFFSFVKIGETDKWIGVSEQRFYDIISTTDYLSVSIKGGVGETVHVSFVNPDGQQVVVDCTIGETEAAKVSVPDKSCVSV